MASCSSLLSPEDIKEKIRRVLDINNETVKSDQKKQNNQDDPDKQMKDLSKKVDKPVLPILKSPLGITKMKIYRASEEHTARTLEFIFCELNVFKKEEFLGLYLSIYELMAPGITSSNEAVEFFKDFNYEVVYFRISSDEDSKNLVVPNSSSKYNNPLNPKKLLLGVCLYVQLLIEEPRINVNGMEEVQYRLWLSDHIKRFAFELGIRYEDEYNEESFWFKRFAPQSICKLIHHNVNVMQPLRAICLRGIQQMSITNIQGREAFKNILRRLEWINMEHLKLIFTHLLREPFFKLLSKPPFSHDLPNLQRALTLLDGLDSADVPYAHLLRDNKERMVLDEENLTVFLLAVKVIASSTEHPSSEKHKYPAMTPYLMELEPVVLRMITAAAVQF